jgi:hypothetical protein
MPRQRHRREPADQRRHQEATMELRMRMNVLAAIMSFGFVAAIVLGVI